MSDGLKEVLLKAKEAGATPEQLLKIAQVYKKKDSTESPSTGEEETTSGVSTEEPKAAEESAVEIPNWMRNFQDKAPKVEYEVKGVSEKAKKPTETQEEYVQRVAPTEGEKAFQSRVSDFRAEVGVDTYDSIYDEAGIPERLRPEKGSGVSVLLEQFDLEQAGKSREADQAIDEYESLFKGKQIPFAAGGYGTVNSVESTPESDLMTERELELKRQEALSKVNQSLKTDFQDLDEAKNFVYDKYEYHKTNLAEMSLEKAKQSYIDDKALFSKGEQLLSLALGRIGWDGKVMQTDAVEEVEGFFNAVVDPVVRNVGLNAAIATMDAMGNGYGAELLQAEKDVRATQGLLNVGLDPQDSRGITETWDEGDKGLAVLKAFYFGSQSMGLMAATIIQPEVGLTMMGVSSGLETYGAFRDRLDLSAEDKNTLAISAGVVEVAMGQVLGGLANVRRFRSAMGISDDIGAMSMTAKRNAYNRAINYLSPYSKRVKEALKSPAVRGTGRFIYDTGAEAVEEFGVELFNQTLAHAIAGEEFDPYALADATLLGGMIGAPMATVTGAKAYGIESHFFNKPLREDMEAYETLQTQYADLKQAAREEKDPAKKKIILEEAAKVREEGQELIQKANKAYDSLSFDERAQLSKINKEITRLVDEIKSTDNKTIKSRRKNELAGLLLKKAQIESKAGLDLQLSSEQETGIDEVQAQSIAEYRTTPVEGLPLRTAMDMVAEMEAKREKRLKEAESRDRSPESPMENSLNQRVRYIDPATNETVEGVLAKDGQTLVVETDEGNIIELGNAEQLAGRSLESLSLSAAEGILQVNEDGSFTYAPVAGAKGASQGTKMYNRNGVKAIRRDKNGNVKNVLLTSEDGSQTYNLKGEDAEEAAYQILLKETSTPEGQKRVDEALAQEAQDRELLAAASPAPAPAPAPAAPAAEPEPAQPKIIGLEKLSPEMGASVARMLNAIIHISPNHTVEVLNTNEDVRNKWKELSGEEADSRLKGFNDPNTNTIYISQESTLNDRRSDGLHIAKHELMHPVVNALMSSDPVLVQRLVSQVTSLLMSMPTNRVAQLVYAHATQYSGNKFNEELLVEFFNYFSNEANFQEAVKEKPSLKKRIVSVLNTILERMGLTYRFSYESPNTELIEMLSQVKQAFDSGVPMEIEAAEENRASGLQAYMGIRSAEPSVISDFEANMMLSLLDGNYAAQFGGNVELDDFTFRGLRAKPATFDTLSAIAVFLADKPVIEINQSVKEGIGDKSELLLDVLSSFGYRVVSNGPSTIMAAPAFNNMLTETTGVESVTADDLLDMSIESNRAQVSEDVIGNLEKVADALGIDVAYINKPDINAASGYLKPSKANGIKSPVVFLNVANASPETSLYGVSAMMIEVMRKAAGKPTKATSYLYELEAEIMRVSEKLQASPDTLTDRERNFIVPILFKMRSYQSQSSQVPSSYRSNQNQQGQALVFALSDVLNEILQINSVRASKRAKDVGVEFEQAFLDIVNENAQIPAGSVEATPFDIFLKAVFVDKVLSKAVMATSLDEAIRKETAAAKNDIALKDFSDFIIDFFADTVSEISSDAKTLGLSSIKLYRAKNSLKEQEETLSKKLQELSESLGINPPQKKSEYYKEFESFFNNMGKYSALMAAANPNSANYALENPGIAIDIVNSIAMDPSLDVDEKDMALSTLSRLAPQPSNQAANLASWYNGTDKMMDGRSEVQEARFIFEELIGDLIDSRQFSTIDAIGRVINNKITEIDSAASMNDAYDIFRKMSSVERMLFLQYAALRNTNSIKSHLELLLEEASQKIDYDDFQWEEDFYETKDYIKNFQESIRSTQTLTTELIGSIINTFRESRRYAEGASASEEALMDLAELAGMPNTSNSYALLSHILTDFNEASDYLPSESEYNSVLESQGDPVIISEVSDIKSKIDADKNEIRSLSDLIVNDYGRFTFIQSEAEMLKLSPDEINDLESAIKNATLISGTDVEESIENIIKERLLKGESVPATRKTILVYSESAPPGYEYTTYSISAGYSVAFQHEGDFQSISKLLKEQEGWSDEQIEELRQKREQTNQDFNGAIPSSWDSYTNMPASWGYGNRLGIEIMNALHDMSLTLGLPVHSFSPVSSTYYSALSEEYLRRNGVDEALIQKYAVTTKEMQSEEVPEMFRLMLYNTWAKRRLGEAALVLGSQQEFLIAVPKEAGSSEMNLYLIGPNRMNDLFEREQSDKIRNLYKEETLWIRQSLSSNPDIPRTRDLLNQRGIKPLTEEQIEKISNKFGVPMTMEQIKQSSDEFVSTFNKRNIFNKGGAIGKNIVMPSSMTFISTNAKGVLSIPPLTTVSSSEFQAYLDGRDNSDRLMDAQEALRERSEAALKDATEVKWWSWDYISKRWINRNQKLRDSIEKGLSEYTRSVLTRRAGAIRYADTLFKKYEKAIFNGLSIAEEKFLDDIIFLRRVIQIDKNRDFKRAQAERLLESEKAQLEALRQALRNTRDENQKKDLREQISDKKKDIRAAEKTIENNQRPQHPSHPEYNEVNLEEATKRLAAYEQRLGADKYNMLYKRADEYFNAFTDILEMALDAGLIDEGTFDRFKNDDYSPRVFLTHFFGSAHSSAFNGTNLSEDFIKTLKDGSNEDIFLDARMLLSNALRSIRAKGHQNELLSAMHNEAKKRSFEGVDFMKEFNLSRNGKVEKASKGYTNVYYKVDGKLEGFQIKSELVEQLYGNVKDAIVMSPNVRKGFSLISGTQITKFFATGTSTAFAITAFMRFVPEVVFGRGVYDKKGRGFVPLMMAYAAVDSLIGLKDAVFNKELVEEYFRNGGATTWMVAQGKPKRIVKRAKAGAVRNAVDWLGRHFMNGISFAGEKSELAVRLAIYSRVKDSLRKEFPDMPENELQSIATEEALMLADFATSGTVAKSLDTISPYLNAGIQGFRGAASYAKKNPKMFSNKMSQMFVGSFGMALMAVLSVDDDEWEAISDYKKQMYVMIPLGRGEDGKMNWYTHPRAHTFLAVPAVALVLAQHTRDMIRGKSIEGYKKEGLSGQYMDDSEYIWSSIIKSLPLPSLAPVFNAYAAYQYNWDTWRGEKIYKKGGDKEMDAYIEGQYDPYVRDFYKVIALELQDKGIDVSAKRMQAAVEKIITSDKNPVVNLIYNFADALLATGDNLTDLRDKQGITVDEDSVSKKSKYFDSILGVKGRIYVAPDKKEGDKARVRGAKKEENTELFKQKQSVKQVAKKYFGTTITTLPKDVVDTIMKLTDDPTRQRRLKNYFMYLYKGELVDDQVVNVIFSDNDSERLAKIEDILGTDVKDMDKQDFNDVLVQLKTAGMKQSEIQSLLYHFIEKKKQN